MDNSKLKVGDVVSFQNIFHPKSAWRVTNIGEEWIDLEHLETGDTDSVSPIYKHLEYYNPFESVGQKPVHYTDDPIEKEVGELLGVEILSKEEAIEDLKAALLICDEELKKPDSTSATVWVKEELTRQLNELQK